MLSYNRTNATKYAGMWALRRNPKYYDFSAIGGDCTNFASQCLFAGSGFMDPTAHIGWYYYDANHRAPAWTSAEFLKQYLTNGTYRAGPVAQLSSAESLEKGDLIQLSFDGRIFSHTLVVMNTKPEILICAHSDDSFLRRLSTYNYKDIRYLHIVGVTPQTQW